MMTLTHAPGLVQTFTPADEAFEPSADDQAAYAEMLAEMEADREAALTAEWEMELEARAEAAYALDRMDLAGCDHFGSFIGHDGYGL